MEGEDVGSTVEGRDVGSTEGSEEGIRVGLFVLRIDGLKEGRLVGRKVGTTEDDTVGNTEEVEVGSAVGLQEEGNLVGQLVGANLGLRLGELDEEGQADGLDVGGVDEAAEGVEVLTTVGASDGS